jgi:hypothetical protein
MSTPERSFHCSTRALSTDRSEEVDVEHTAELLVFEPMRLCVDGDHGVGDVRVDAAEALDGLVDEPLHLVALRDVDLDRDPLGAPGFDLGDRVLEGFSITSADDDGRAAIRDGPRDRPPEPVRPAGDHHDLLRERLLPRHPSRGLPASTGRNALP